MNNNFFKKYLEQQKKLLSLNNATEIKLERVKKDLENIKKNKRKVMIFGNGGSAAIANHFSVDLTKNSKIRCVNFNESSLLTCFSNDFGYENWIKKSLEIYGSPKDLLILISCSGNSKNLINANNYAKNIGMKVATLTGCKKTNKLNSNKYNHSIWINSKDYNVVESIHHTILLTIVDSIKKKFKK